MGWCGHGVTALSIDTRPRHRVTSVHARYWGSGPSGDLRAEDDGASVVNPTARLSVRTEVYTDFRCFPRRAADPGGSDDERSKITGPPDALLTDQEAKWIIRAVDETHAGPVGEQLARDSRSGCR